MGGDGAAGPGQAGGRPPPGLTDARGERAAARFLAPYAAADRTGPGGGAPGEHEGVTVVERRLRELGAEARDGRIADAKLLTLVQALALRRPDLLG